MAAVSPPLSADDVGGSFPMLPEENNLRSRGQQKLDEVLSNLEKLTAILKGDTTNPGLITRVDKIETDVNGDGKELGIRNKVSIMWAASRIAAGVLCTGLGYLLHPYMTKLVALLK